MKSRQKKPGNTATSEEMLAMLSAELERKNELLKIEAALDKVRARTMAMQKSSELNETTALLFRQFAELGAAPSQISICVFDEASRFGDMYYTLKGESVDHSHRIELEKEAFVMKYTREAFLRGDKTFSHSVTGKKLQQYNKWRNELVGKKRWDESAEVTKKSWYVFSAMFSRGILGYSAETPVPEETQQLLQRFAAVFDLVFRRFLDLQQAEAQLRESHIEAGLERVRGQAMAMHKSEDLLQVIPVLAEEMKQLGFNIHSANFNTSYRQKDWNLWLYNPGALMDPVALHVPYFDHPYFNRTLAALENGDDFNAFVFTKEEKDGFLDHLYANTVARNAPEERRKFTYDKPGFAWSAVYLKNTAVTIANYDAQPYTAEQNAVLRKFAGVFEQSYVRFLDLQKAEAQAREAQIEAGLERVRARAMAMRNSDELNLLIGTVFQELTKLDLVLTRCTIMIFDPNTNDSRWWMLNAEAPDEPNNYLIPFHELPPYLAFVANWKSANKKWIFDLKGEEKKQWDAFLFTKTGLKDLPPPVIAGMKAPGQVLLTASFNNFGALNTASLEPLSEEQIDILLRFANVFDLTYTRFNDLKQAEMQAKEARIEAALERVRAKAMAMHSTEHLADTISTFYHQLGTLGLTPRRCGVGVISKESRVSVLTSMYTTAEGEAVQIIGNLTLAGHPMLDGVYEHWLKQEEYYPVLKGAEIKSYYELISPQISYPDMPHEATQYGYFFFFPEGGVYAWSETEIAEDDLTIYRRFRSVLSLTYKRYNDLRLAEAQAREAQIESSLERVRGKAMAMQQAEDVLNICALLFTELQKQGFGNLRNTMINIHDDDKATFLNYDYSESAGKNITHYHYNHHPVIEKLVRQTRSATDAFSEIILSGKELEDWRSFRIKSGEKDDSRLETLDNLYYYFYSIGTGAVGISSFHPLVGDQLNILKRFRNVFELAYRRYIDITTAAAQAREAQIEAALERVRSAAMAMHSSEDIGAATAILFSELDKLQITTLRCGVVIINEDRTMEAWTSVPDSEGKINKTAGLLDMTIHPLLLNAFEAWKRRDEMFEYKLEGNDIGAYYKALGSSPTYNVPTPVSQGTHYSTLYYFREGALYTFTDDPHSAETQQVMKRFTSVFALTFRRYQDLIRAEFQAKEATRQASLDRVRAEIASMRSVSDLDRITPLIWNELNILNIPFTRCGVFIMDDEMRQTHTFLSTPDGKAIAAFHLPYDASGNLAEVISAWRRKEVYVNHWNKADFQSIAATLVAQGAIAQEGQYLDSLPAEGIYLHFLPFLQGMLYVGNTAALQEDETGLLQSVADAFSTAYARYEDFNKLEAAKMQVDKALSELKQAQQQLVQSEKMASLGELTAGIAHEIQNPLNFVNNFSEVSNELLEEMKVELDKGDANAAKAIADDVKQNLEKILHHGKRADGIVKGMLQHSRSGSGQKEPTDINKLADEYVRLAYHGLRAKDKSFNAKFNTNFDPAIGSINVITQDIGRVILNLINNAFYAVSEKQKQQLPGYEATVSVCTRKENDRIEIAVTDNGNGIPASVVNKIFQPFFTTKPTGQGTGLGLSLSYDIITKGHAGELKVETAEGEGTTFTIELPNQNGR